MESPKSLSGQWSYPVQGVSTGAEPSNIHCMLLSVNYPPTPPQFQEGHHIDVVGALILLLCPVTWALEAECDEWHSAVVFANATAHRPSVMPVPLQSEFCKDKTATPEQHHCLPHPKTTCIRVAQFTGAHGLCEELPGRDGSWGSLS